MLILAATEDKARIEEFNEELLLRPLPDRKVLAHFHFDSQAKFSSNNGGYHSHLFPKAIYQLVCSFPLFFFTQFFGSILGLKGW